MSKLVSLLIVLLAIAVATPVLAEERLSLSGQMRVRGFNIDNQFDFNDDAGGSAAKSFNQRLRIGAKLSAAEGVSVNMRADWNEGTWGQTRTALGVDRAFLAVDKQMFKLSAGRQFYSIGNAIAVDITGDGAVFTLKGAVPVEVGYFKLIERTPLQADNDVDLYTLAVKHSTDMYNAVVFGGYARDGGEFPGDVNTDLYGFGVQAGMKLDPIALNVELNYFTGEVDEVNGNEFKGLQAYVDVNMPISETVAAGARFFYAQGQNNTTEFQITELVDDGSFLPETYSFMEAQYNIFPTGNGSLNTTFDPTGDGLGVIAAQLYGHFKVMDALSLRASVGYWEPEDDQPLTNDFKSFITATGSARYALAAKTNLDGVVAYTMPETRNNAPDDAAVLFGFNLNVSF